MGRFRKKKMKDREQQETKTRRISNLRFQISKEKVQGFSEERGVGGHGLTQTSTIDAEESGVAAVAGVIHGYVLSWLRLWLENFRATPCRSIKWEPSFCAGFAY
jgi:hypothetical protein